MRCEINVKEASFTVGVDPPDFRTIASFDAAGRLIGVYRRDRDGTQANYRRGLDNRIIRLVKDDALRNRVVQTLAPVDRDRLLDETFAMVRAARDDAARTDDERRRLDLALASGPAQLVAQRDRFIAIYGAVPILPPDQYRALVVQATRGCPFNDCKFCSFYRGCEFRVPDAAEFNAHLDAVRAFFGESLRLRRSVFLGDANAVLIPTARLLERMEQVRQRFDVAPADLPPDKEAAWRHAHPYGLIGFHGFLDGMTGTRKSADDYRRLAAAGLKRVYIGAESGCDTVLERLGKPCRRAHVVETVTLCKQAGVAVALIFLAGICADDAALAARHLGQSVALVGGLPLDAADIVYLSPYVADRTAATLDPFVEQQLDAFEQGVRRAAGRSRVVVYDIRGFIY